MAYRAGQSAVASLIFNFSRLAVQSWQPTVFCYRCIRTQSSPLLFHASQQMWSEPVKKKKKIDPGILAAREVKRKKKIEKQMKRLEKFGRKLKPVDEIDVEPKLRKEIKLRTREPAVLTNEEAEARALLMKQWSRYKFRQFVQETSAIGSLIQAQETALEELKFESPELYQMAIQADKSLIPFAMKGLTATPPIKGFDAPDGEYIDSTKTFE